MKTKAFRFSFIIFALISSFQLKSSAQVWQPDNGDGTYKNPIIFADYSDPDVIRVKDDFYMVASSFNCAPGIPVLHSKDLVNWTIIGHVYEKLPLERYNHPQLGEGSWAPSIRYHNGKFYVYVCTPTDGLFMASTNDPSKKWDMVQVADVVNWEDPCPIWDDNGDAYLVHGKVCAGVLYLHKLSADGTKLLDNGKVVFNDTKSQPTIEGPKFIKKDGYYYILSPAGGVETGWQAALRSKNIYGPYEQKTVMHQGNTSINGPHQGGLVETQTGEWWFIHFQDRGAYGRIVHLQPAEWVVGWPIIGKDNNNDGIGEPVMTYKKPNVGKTYPIENPQTSDEFNSDKLGLQWQWWANPQPEFYSLTAN
jgi:beta-xylosidase